MSSSYDPTEFVDGDFQAHKLSSAAAAAGGPAERARTREETDAALAERQQRLAELKRAQEELERERASLEETRRRQIEFQTGRQEVVQQLTRGLGLLEEAEFGSRRDAEQMAKAITEMREALNKVTAVHEETWTKDSFEVDLTRALTALENARMELNSARLKFPVLSGRDLRNPEPEPAVAPAPPSSLANVAPGELVRLGLALTWPLAAVGLLAFAALLILLLRQ